MAIPISKEKQVQYNFRKSKDNLNSNEWWFLIINQNREIEEIQNRIYGLFSPIIDEKSPFGGVVKGTGLRYKVLNFDSFKFVERRTINDLYKTVKLNPSLYRRVGDLNLEEVIADKLEI